jgi:hypothetical protein
MEVEKMKRTITVISAEIIPDNQLRIHIGNTYSLNGVSATGNMLVDSSKFAFVYILEVNGEYTYLLLEEDVWNVISEALNKFLPVFLSNQVEELPLPNFMEEMDYLIENIKGNSNYGEEMVEKVETIF